MRLVPKTFVAFSVLILFAVACRDDAERPGAGEAAVQPLSPADSLYLQAEKYREDAKYDSAIGFYWDAKAMYNDERNMVQLVTCMNHIGDCLRRKGKYDDAWAHLDSTLAIGKRLFGEQDTVVAKTYHHMGAVKWKKGEFDEAMLLYGKSLDINLPIVGENHADVAYTYNNIGIVLRRRGEYDSALAYYKKALVIRARNDNSGTPELAQSYHNIGVVLKNKGELERSIEYYEKALKIREDALGPDHVGLASSYNNLGNVYKSIGDFEMAAGFYRRSLLIRTSKIEEMNDGVAAIHNNLGIVEAKMGNYDKAIAHYEKAERVWSSLRGTEFSELGFVFHNMGLSQLKKGEFGPAVLNLKRSVRVFSAAFGENHPLVAAGHHRLGVAISKTERRSSAMAEYVTAKVVYESQLGEKHVFVAELRKDIADFFLQNGEFAKGLSFLEKAMNSLCRMESLPDWKKMSKSEMHDAFGFFADPFLLLDCLAKMGNAIWTRSEEQATKKSELAEALSYFEVAIQVVEFIRQGLQYESSKLLLSERSQSIYSSAVALAMQLSHGEDESLYLRKALEFSEQSKANVLKDALRNFSGTEKKSKIPGSLVVKETKLRKRWAFFRQVLAAGFIDPLNTDDFQSISDSLFKVERNFFQLQKKKAQYSKAGIVNDQPPISIILDSLRGNHKRVILEFFVGADSVYLFILNDSELSVQSFHKEFDVAVDKNLRDVSAFQTEPVGSAMAFFLKSAIRENNFLQSRKPPLELLLIPDGALSMVPMEAFDTGVRGKSMIDEFVISYSPSLFLYWLTINSDVSLYDSRILSFAPRF